MVPVPKVDAPETWDTAWAVSMATDALSTAADLFAESQPHSTVMAKVGLGLINGERTSVLARAGLDAVPCAGEQGSAQNVLTWNAPCPVPTLVLSGLAEGPPEDFDWMMAGLYKNLAKVQEYTSCQVS